MWKKLPQTLIVFLPQPLLGQGENWQPVLREVRQILVQISERMRILTQLVVGLPQRVAAPALPEHFEINHKERRNMVLQTIAEVVLPVSLLPKSGKKDFGSRDTGRTDSQNSKNEMRDN